MSESQMDRYRNPDGKLHPVIYNKLNPDGSGQRQYMICQTDRSGLDYVALDPKTKQEVALDLKDWQDIYPQLLNKEPPSNLGENLKLYAKKLEPVASGSNPNGRR